MKKIFLFIAIITGSVLCSCKSHERCPAYGKVTKPETEKQVRPA